MDNFGGCQVNVKDTGLSSPVMDNLNAVSNEDILCFRPFSIPTCPYPWV